MLVSQATAAAAATATRMSLTADQPSLSSKSHQQSINTATLANVLIVDCRTYQIGQLATSFMCYL
ncbi:unnamed protein product [Ceratitis capitata]|uniref:(Mediterranean fruit fly) hypothetical protein n=1 Tax=Ceratitis capitata TaxID=7213 RepID=A0A811U4W4_CERCA|nr:unnamed protein product [Ceratitis capitata]